jgi:hypothetical protein
MRVYELRICDEDGAVRCGFLRPFFPTIPVAGFYVSPVGRPLTPVQSIEPCEGERHCYCRDMAEGWEAEGQSAHLLPDNMLNAHYRRRQNISRRRVECIYMFASVWAELRPAACQDADNFLTPPFQCQGSGQVSETWSRPRRSARTACQLSFV